MPFVFRRLRKQGVELVPVLFAPVVAGGVSGPVHPIVMVRLHEPPRLREVERHEGIVGQPFDHEFPESVVFRGLGIGDAVHDGAAQPFADIGVQRFGGPPRGLRAFLLMDLPQQADEGASLVDQLFTPAGGFQFGHAGGDDAFGVDLEIRRIELEMALGLHERVAAGRHGVHIRLAHGEFREPLGRSLFHFALRQFPEFQRIDVGDFPAALVAFEDFQRRVAGAVLFVGRAGPRQDARGLQGRFPAVRKQQAEPAVLFLQHPCDLGRVALHELNHTPRAGVTNQALNHLESFCCRGREEGTFLEKSSLFPPPSPLSFPRRLRFGAGERRRSFFIS